MPIVITEDDNGSKKRLVDDLEETQREMNRKIGEALDEIWDKIFEAALMLCPIGTGTLISTMKIVKNEFGTELLGGGVGGIPKAIQLFDSVIVAGDEGVTRPDGYPCIYASWVHDGHFTTGGTWVPAQPFLAQAIEMYEQEIYDAVDRVQKEIEKGV